MAVVDKGDYLEYYERDLSDTRKEVAHQIDSFQWLKHNHPELLAWHSVNENEKTKVTAMIDQQSGLLKGVSDFIILIGINSRYPFAAIELKRVNKSGKGKASPVSDKQREFLKKVRDRGGFSAVAYGFEQFKLAIYDLTK